MKASTRIAVLAAVVPALAGCGIFKSSGTSGKYDPKDPNRVAARAVANITYTNAFNDAPSGKATFRAVLFDADGRQFYGPDVTLDGAAVPTTTPNLETGTIYLKGDLAMAVGQTYSTVIQGHGAVSPAVTPPILITSPVRYVDESKNPPVTATYYNQPAGGSATIKWTGGDPSLPVYIQVVGNFDKHGWRRIPVLDDPQQTAGDPENFGLAVPNTGSFTIPAELTERYIQNNGQVATRTVTTFADTQTVSGGVYIDVEVYVLQRRTNVAAPVSFSTIVSAKANASVVPATQG